MNERIKELEDCCWEELGEEEGRYPVFNMKKFAKLIQQDCLQHLTNTGQDHAREILERYFDSR